MADQLGVRADEAARQLHFQEASVAATEAIADRFASRLAGITVEHRPSFRIVVLLTGANAVPNETVDVASEPIPVVYRVGAPASHTELVQAITAYQSSIRSSLLRPPGLGVDQRTGEVVVVVSSKDVAREGGGALRDRLAALTHVPVALRVVDQPTLDLDAIGGGGRVVGSVPGDPHRYVCTAGFVVTDGTRTGLATAAHCPDALSVQDRDGREQPLPFVGQWGWGNQDVQINTSPDPLPPFFFADSAKTISRPVTGARSRAGMRAGDVVCHRGERTGYSCSQVDLTDFAPAGDLCGGACLPTWTTVTGPMCKGGDSGSPVFLGTTAYGILKGGSYRVDGSCAFYFYMSIDYLPTGWRLLMANPLDATVTEPLPIR
ncbi:MAG: S1 family peptidase [Pseudomonadota bacterium]|nr:S1 family peptidase [Pseudomonadota bacterium]